MPIPTVVGIDLNTTFSLAAAIDDGGWNRHHDNDTSREIKTAKGVTCL